ncbi:5-dehydro-4-deoxyglucarate dehydratase [Streptomyces ureilyticus]|uniref:Probable 5-dehydro-4-deoxyglucarate dehydratase n=1 Tax=Streptomyces ureilyticus TaxID=1775131 RepID=A0ABX0DWI3_9ACTN|nr:5-dehydro-4-deoxyglucarate dehydratase [Streptomyces ureilyticus]NGO45209.1 5-dehydro-4-deoxyglucarate dehydratase [Streptomyces ureilyticus]
MKFPKLKGVQFFPVTPFGTDGALAGELLAQHIDSGVRAGAGGVFVACGTGEFHALSPEEIERATRVAVETTAGRVPVLSAAGGPVPTVLDQVARIERAGADGILLLPPYLVTAPQEGLLRYVETVTAATTLPVVFYQRGTARLTAPTAAAIAALPGVIGLKDGIGDIELMHRIVRAVRALPDSGDFQFFNGLPTAEMTVPAYQGIGVELYSSAVFAFAPEIALAFHQALAQDDQTLVATLLTEFYAPLVELRDAVPGYAVSLVKAGVRIRGLDVGGVRPPLLDPTPEHLARLTQLIDHGLEAVKA